ncbi:hypothetical protein [Rhodosalinus sp. 5P4]|uniref:hypothetical protein n=1 Tax=Rhodosalinus sp. 5P4 TaxID=3239196 RepID=UPI003525A704
MPADSPDLQILDIDAALDLSGAQSVHASLCARLADLDPGRPVRLELGEGRATAPALQLLQATRLALQARDIDPALGPRARAALGPPPRET